MRTCLKMLAASAALGLGSVPAMASGGVFVSFGGHGHQASCATHGSYTGGAGVLVIDGRRVTIRAGGGALNEIASAFRRAGYSAQCQGGRVVVRWSRGRPDVRWFGEGWHASLGWSRDCLTVTMQAPSCGCDGRRGPSVRVTLPVRQEWCPPTRFGPPKRPGWGRPGGASRSRCG